MTLANKITVIRIVTVPIFLIALLNRDYRTALLVGGLSGVTDALDGLVARRFKQHTPLGKFLDPVADKLLLVATYGGFVHLGDIPSWVLVVTVSKDLIVFLGWALVYVLSGASEVHTRRSGKVATASQMVFGALVLSCRAFPIRSPSTGILLFFSQWLMVAFTIISMLDYVLYGSRRLAQSGQN